MAETLSYLHRHEAFEKVNVSHLPKKIPALQGTRNVRNRVHRTANLFDRTCLQVYFDLRSFGLHIVFILYNILYLRDISPHNMMVVCF